MADVQKTLAMIKPDAVRAGAVDAIRDMIKANGFTIISEMSTSLSAERAGDFYREHQGKPFFDPLVEFMTSGPIHVLCLAKRNAIVDWRTLMGPTDVAVAKAEQPHTVRAKFGTSKTFNAVHGSDSPASAKREVKFWFPTISVDPLPSKEQTRDYIERELQTVLIKGLTELSKAKPENPRVWLANWLLENNPNKPLVRE